MRTQKICLAAILLLVAGTQASGKRTLTETTPQGGMASGRTANVSTLWPIEPEVFSPAEKVQGCKVAVVGAAYGGLYFAYRLALDEGRVSATDVCIFEASPGRIGGKVYSVRNLGDPELVVDVGAYRYAPFQKLVAGLVEGLLGLNTRCYYPLTCEDSRRVVMDPSGLNLLGYGGPLEDNAERFGRGRIQGVLRLQAHRRV